MSVAKNGPPTAGEAAVPEGLRRDVLGTALFGAIVVVLFFVVGGLWAATAPLAGSVIAEGIVSTVSSRQTIQHLEGGIIREIHVQDGDQVLAGDVMMVLESIGPEAEAGAKMSQLRSLAALEARLIAERDGAARIVFDHPSLGAPNNKETQAAIRAQEEEFATRRANDAGRVSILNQRVAQLAQQIEGFRHQIESTRRQYRFIEEEIAGVRTLFEKGLERKPRLLALQRGQAELVGVQGQLEAQIAGAEEAIGETRLQILNLSVQRREDVSAELAKVQSARVSLEEKMRTTLDRLRRTSIRAPMAGTVLNHRFKTLGGVVRAGGTILDLVPLEGDLVVEIRIHPTDIDDVAPGQNAFVAFPTFPQRHVLRIKGNVLRVGADAQKDEQTGAAYFSGRVSVERADLREIAPDMEISAGMPTEVFIATREQTLLDYLLQPLFFTIERAMRES